jgi:hypothetical protein
VLWPCSARPLTGDVGKKAIHEFTRKGTLLRVASGEFVGRSFCCLSNLIVGVFAVLRGGQWGYANGKENCPKHSEKIAGFALSHMVLLYL